MRWLRIWPLFYFSFLVCVCVCVCVCVFVCFWFYFLTTCHLWRITWDSKHIKETWNFGGCPMFSSQFWYTILCVCACCFLFTDFIQMSWSALYIQKENELKGILFQERTTHPVFFKSVFPRYRHPLELESTPTLADRINNPGSIWALSEQLQFS